MSSARKATPKQVFLRDRAEKCQFLIQPWKLMDLTLGLCFPLSLIIRPARNPCCGVLQLVVPRFLVLEKMIIKTIRCSCNSPLQLVQFFSVL